MIYIQKSIIVLSGLPFSGKSTIGKALAAKYEIPFLDIDKTRHEIAPDGQWLGPEKEREVMMAAYTRNHEKASHVIESGKAVILAATYSRESYHEMLRKLAQKHQVPLKVFLLNIPNALVPLRLQERLRQGSPSNIITIDSYDEVKDRYMPFQGEELIRIDTSQSVEEVLNAISRAIT